MNKAPSQLANEKTLRTYQTNDGKKPFDEWLRNLKNRQATAKIRARLLRVRAGLLGDTKSVGQGVHELRIPIGKGYRVYYGNDGIEIVLLLCGGDKKSQPQDIQLAKEYWNDYKKRNKC